MQRCRYRTRVVNPGGTIAPYGPFVALGGQQTTTEARWRIRTKRHPRIEETHNATSNTRTTGYAYERSGLRKKISLTAFFPLYPLPHLLGNLNALFTHLKQYRSERQGLPEAHGRVVPSSEIERSSLQRNDNDDTKYGRVYHVRSFHDHRSSLARSIILRLNAASLLPAYT